MEMDFMTLAWACTAVFVARRWWNANRTRQKEYTKDVVSEVDSQTVDLTETVVSPVWQVNGPYARRRN